MPRHCGRIHNIYEYTLLIVFRMKLNSRLIIEFKVSPDRNIVLLIVPQASSCAKNSPQTKPYDAYL